MASKPKKVPDHIDTKDIKVRKRIAPGVRIIKSAKDKERKHKQNYLEEQQED